MSEHHHDDSRIDKYEKRRKNTKSLSIFIVMGSILLLVLLALLIFGGGKNEADENTNSTNTEQASQKEGNSDKQDKASQSSGENNPENSDDNTEKEETEKEEKDDLNKQEVEGSDDNVVKAYTADWQPVGTSQSGQHTTNYNKGSQDLKEMRKAAATATGLGEESLIMWWVTNNGEQKVLATVSSGDESEVYRVYLTWVENKGWKPTKVEELKENDQKYRFN